MRAEGWLLADRSDRTRLLVAGPDRLKCLHNLTTQHVKDRQPGEHTEAFVTSPQGRVLGFVTLHFGPDAVLVRADPGTAPALMQHLRKYGAFDDVRIDDVSEKTFEVTVLSHSSAEAFPEIGAEWHIPESLRNLRGTTWIGPSDQKAALIATLGQAVEVLSTEQWDALRIEAGVPVHGIDITDANLPQEAARNARAIHFNKGCYLGQETVARLDALGHVNKILRGVRALGNDALSPGSELFAGEKRVGTITSAARSLQDGRAIGLATIRVGSEAAGTRLRAGGPEGTEVEVVEVS
jgi:folate-binding protein YgfZ